VEADHPHCPARASGEQGVRAPARCHRTHVRTRAWAAAHIGQRIIFSGRLLGGHIPKAGKSLLIEGVDRGLLVPVSRGLRTDRRGHWRFAYVFHNQTGAAYTYAFHLAIPFDSVYPYLPAATHALPVTILNP